MGLAAITLHEKNDEVLRVTITPLVEGETLDGITLLEVYLKPDQCTPDGDSSVLLLTSADPTQIDVTEQTSDLITARVFIPATALAQPYDRWWRLDALDADGGRRTALYGPVEVINL